MPDEHSHSETEDNPASTRSGGVNIDGDAIHIRGDVVGRDKIIGYTVEQVSVLLTQIGATFQPKPFDGRSPYVGLNAFDEEDAERFFGREKLIDELSERVNRARFLVIAGPSGSGKSSLIRAGLIAALKRGALRGSEGWRYATLRPGRDALEQLALAMSRMASSPDAADYIRRTGLNDSAVLHKQVESLLSERDNQRALIFVDQFEETFTQVTQEDKRKAFLDTLVHAATAENGRAIVLFAVRSDFIPNFASYPQLNKLLNQQFMQIGAMQPEELVSAIARPALQVGLKIDPELIAQIVNDMQDEPGALPLMQFTLNDLFEAQKVKGSVIALTLSDYLARGGIHKSLERHADAAFARLDASEQRIARDVFSGLIQVGRGREDTRRTALFRELIPAGVDAARIEEVAQKLAGARLITTDIPQTSETSQVLYGRTITIAHEKLIDAWPWLRRLVNENRDAIALQNQIAEDAQEWQHNESDASYLYKGARLATAREQIAANKLTLSELARAFIGAAIQAEENELEAARRRVEEQTRIATQLRRLAVFLAGALIVAAVSFVVAFVFGQQASRNAAEAHSLALATSARLALGNDDTDLALALASEANRVEPAPLEAQRMLAEAAYAPGTRRRYSGHQEAVLSVALSPDGRTGLSGSADQHLILWDLDSGTIIRRFVGHSNWVTSVAFSPDGSTALSGSADNTVILWDVASGMMLRRFVGHTDEVTSVAFHPNGHSMISGSKDKSLILWDIESGSEVRRFSGHTEAVTSVAFSPDGDRVLSGSHDATLRVWDVESGAEMRSLTGHTAGVLSVAFSPDSRTALSGSVDTSLILWDLEAGVEIKRLQGHDVGVTSVAFSPDGRRAISGSGDNNLILWDIQSGDQIHRFIGHAAPVSSVAFSADGRAVLSGAWDTTLRLWAIDNGAELRHFDGHEDIILSVDLSPNGQTALSGSADNTMILWDVASGMMLRRFVGHTNWVHAVAFSPDGRTALSGSADHHVILWNIADGTEIRRFVGHADEVISVAFSPKGDRALSGSRDHNLILWDVASGTELRRFVGHSDWIWSVAFSADGNTILSGSSDRSLRVWDADSGTEIRRFEMHPRGVLSVAVHPDGRTFLSGSADGIVRLWSMDLETEVRRFVGHTNWVTDVAFNRDGSIAVSASRDGSVRLWDVASGAELRRFVGHTDSVSGIAFSADGDAVLSASWDKSLRLWWASTNAKELIEWTQANRYTYELSCVERKLYLVEPLCNPETVRSNEE